MNTFSRLAAAAIVIAASSPAAMALDIKGIEAGKPLDCERIKREGSSSGGPCNGGDSKRLAWTTTLLGTQVVIVASIDPGSNTVKTAAVAGTNFDDMRPALAKKFGEPVCTGEAVTNGYGGKFTSTFCRWDSASGVMLLTRNVQKLGETTLVLIAHKAVEEAAREREKAASDL